jgi:predicted RecB family nuclease
VPADRKITLDVLRGYLSCPYLAYLLLAGQEGTRSDYEIVLAELEQAVRLTVTDRLRSQHSDQSLGISVAVDRSTLSKGFAFLLDAELRDDSLSIRFDGLKRVNGRSQPGDFHYIPLMFCGTRHIRRPQRLLLEVMGLLLSRIQGIAPSTGIIYHGLPCASTTVRFTGGLRAAQELLDVVTRMQRGDETPNLLLNSHCPACEFRRQCHSQAVEEDNLSLLRD